MLNHDQNPVQPEIEITGEDELSKVSEEKQELEVQDTQANVESEPKVEPEEAPAEEAIEPEQPATPQPIMEEEPAIEEEVKVEEDTAPEVEAEPTLADPYGDEDEQKAELSPEEQEHEEMLSMYEESFSNLKQGEIIEGTIVDVSDKEVRIDVGYKTEGVIALSEFQYSGTPEKGSVIKVFISKFDANDGRLILSKKKADYLDNIERIKKAFENDEVLQGVIRKRVKGGMIVEVYGIDGFLPGSQMSLKPIPNLDQFINKEMSFKVLNLDEDKNNIILSRRVVMEEEAKKRRDELIENIKIGSELDGEVKNITQYGAFIDLGGIDGLLHLTDMSWGKLNHPSEMLAIGDKVRVKVISFDPDSEKISLSQKELVPHPWENIEIKYPEGTKISGKVVSIKSFGAFVELEPGVEGLVHISEMSWTKKISDARKFLKTGDTINAIVMELDKENKRISLGMRQMDANPWLTIEDRYPIGTVLKRRVKSLTAFGAFVEIEDGIDGLVHISDISWTKRIYHPRDAFHRGQEVETIVLSIDSGARRIALGIKQLAPDPWEKLNETLPVNTEVKGKISKLIPKGVLVDIPLNGEMVEGFIPISHLALPKLEHSEDAFHVGEELPLKVIELDMENRRLILSVKAFFFSRDPLLQEEYIAIHEQYMREKVARQLKKKSEKQQKEKQQAEKKKQAAEAEKVEQKEAAQEPVAEEAVAVVEEPVAAVEEAVVDSPKEEVLIEAAEEVVEEPALETEVVLEEPIAEPEEAALKEATEEEKATEESPE